MDSCNPPILMFAALMLVPLGVCVFLFLQARRAEKARRETVDAMLHWNHALRTPLTTLSGITELLETSQQNMDDNQKKLVGTLKSATLSLKKITAEIADSPLMNEARDRNAK